MSQFATRINDTTYRISANMLRLGMFVCRLDRPWLGTPFLMQGFLVQSQTELKQLKHLCDVVYIDTEKSLVNLKTKRSRGGLFKRRAIDEDISFSPSIDRNLASAGIRKSLPTYTDTIRSLRSCIKACDEDYFVKSRPLEKQMSRCLDSVMNDTTAMAWLSRVKSHDQYTSEHSMHVCLLAMVFAIHCGWTREEALNAGLAGLLFDLGKTRIPKKILNKPAPLSETEWSLMQEHTKYGRYFLEKSGFHIDVVNAACYHHERPDGEGYGTGRVGMQTPKIARLIHLLDAYDAMISYRPYAEQKTVFEATQVLYRGRGTEFDAILVDQFIAMIGVYPVGTLVELTSGEVAVIIGQNNDARLLPKVAVMRDYRKNPVDETVVNLRDIRDDEGKPRVGIKTMLHDGSYGVFMQEYTQQLIVS